MIDESFLRGTLLKVLAIIGFSATILLIGWSILMLFTHGQSMFSSLAGKIRNMYQTSPEISLVEEIIVESGSDTQQEITTSELPIKTPVAPSTTEISSESSAKFIDLDISILGTGIVERGVFSFTQSYREDRLNAVMIDIVNKGNTLSDSWSFITSLPDGSTYTSPMQAPLKPEEHAIFTLQYEIGKSKGNSILSTVLPIRDATILNNTTMWSVTRN